MEQLVSHGYLRCRIEWTNIIVGNVIVWKTPPLWSDKYDSVIVDNFEEIDPNKEYIIEEYIHVTNY